MKFCLALLRKYHAIALRVLRRNIKGLFPTVEFGGALMVLLHALLLVEGTPKLLGEA